MARQVQLQARMIRRATRSNGRVLVVIAFTRFVPGCGAGSDLDDVPVGADGAGERGHDAAARSPAAAADVDAAPSVDQPPVANGAEAPAPENARPDIDAIAWAQGGNVGFGVASKDTRNTGGNNAALVYGGYESTLNDVKGWASALYRADLVNRGVRHLFAIQGPNTIPYSNKEMGNTSIIAALLPKIDATTKFILVLGHSSGSYVAHELLGQVAGGFDPGQKMAGKLVYFNLDGGTSGFTSTVATKMRKTYWVAPRDVQKGTPGFNNPYMEAFGATYQSLGGVLRFDASAAGCNAGARGCVHDSLVIDRPHDPARATPSRDYDDYSGGRKPTIAYLLQKATEAGLVAR